MENREYLKAHLKSAAQILTDVDISSYLFQIKKNFFYFLLHSYERNLFIDLPLQFDKKKVEILLQNNDALVLELCTNIPARGISFANRANNILSTFCGRGLLTQRCSMGPSSSFQSLWRSSLFWQKWTKFSTTEETTIKGKSLLVVEEMVTLVRWAGWKDNGEDSSRGHPAPLQ